MFTHFHHHFEHEFPFRFFSPNQSFSLSGCGSAFAVEVLLPRTGNLKSYCKGLPRVSVATLVSCVPHTQNNHPAHEETCTSSTVPFMYLRMIFSGLLRIEILNYWNIFEIIDLRRTFDLFLRHCQFKLHPSINRKCLVKQRPQSAFQFSMQQRWKKTNK